MRDVTVPALAERGDLVMVNDMPVTVLQVCVFPPGTHPEDCPVNPGHVARQVVTRPRSLWQGHRPGARYRGAEILGDHPRGVSFEV